LTDLMFLFSFCNGILKYITVMNVMKHNKKNKNSTNQFMGQI